MADSPDTAQGINVGDAVLTFLGDTTQLDVAFDRVATQAEVKMAAAAASISQVGDAADELGEELDATGENAAYAGEEIKKGMGEGRRAIGEARGEAALLGEAFGIHLPRHVRSFIAELPGVGTALSSAFAATAVFFLIDALIKGSEKLSDWIAETFIYTEAMKKSDEAIKEQNKSLLELADQIDKDTEALDKFGKTQSEIKSDKVAALRDEIAKNKTLFETAAKAAREYATAVHESKPEEAAEQLGKLNGVLGAIASGFARVAVAEDHVFESITSFFTGAKTPAQLAEEAEQAGKKAQATATETAKKLADEKHQLSLAEKEAAAQAVSDQEDAAKKTIAIAETVGMAQIKVWAATAGYEARFAKDAAEAILKVQQERSEKEYQIKLQTLERERAAEQHAAVGYDATGDEAAAKKQVELVKETNAKIESLNAEHYQKAFEQQKAANDAFAAAAVASAKLVEEAQLQSIEKWKAAQLAAYVAGQSSVGAWEGAEIHATDAAAIAHETYLKRVIAVYAQQGDAQKAQAAEH
jgi:hypothetical protein